MATLTAVLVAANLGLLLLAGWLVAWTWRRERILTAAVTRVVAEMDTAIEQQRKLRERYVAVAAELPRIEREIAGCLEVVAAITGTLRALTGGARTPAA